MKYILFRVVPSNHPNDRYWIPIIFPDVIIHSSMAHTITNMPQFRHDPIVAVSAGDYNPANGECSGYSASLDITSSPGDTELIRTGDTK